VPDNSSVQCMLRSEQDALLPSGMLWMQGSPCTGTKALGARETAFFDDRLASMLVYTTSGSSTCLPANFEIDRLANLMIRCFCLNFICNHV
jgi:hypothetical protein